MNVGILTWHNVLNYGSVLQTYALSKEIESMDCNCEVLAHDRALPDYLGKRGDGVGFGGFVRWVRNQTPNRRKNREAAATKYDAFLDFRKKYLNEGALYNACNDDAVLIGSDQIFDINGIYYPYQFGLGVSAARIGCYAPSFGETRWDDLVNSEHFEEICTGIRAMELLTARDANTQGILERITGSSVPVVLDPTLLYDWSAERSIWNKRLIKEPYCLVYTWGGYTISDEFAKQCRSFAKRTGLKLVSVGEIRNWCDIQWAQASPIEFFELWMHTDMVLTNMFHGTCFSLLFEKPFYSFVMPHNENKLGGLLMQLEAEAQILRSPGELNNKRIPVIEYERCNIRLRNMRIVSRKCLEMYLGEPQSEKY